MAPHTHGKRKLDAIDLTGDDDVGSSSQASRGPPGDVTQTQRDSWMEQGDEADAEDVIITSQDGDDSVTQSYQLYGTLGCSNPSDPALLIFLFALILPF